MRAFWNGVSGLGSLVLVASKLLHTLRCRMETCRLPLNKSCSTSNLSHRCERMNVGDWAFWKGATETLFRLSATVATFPSPFSLSVEQAPAPRN